MVQVYYYLDEEAVIDQQEYNKIIRCFIDTSVNTNTISNITAGEFEQDEYGTWRYVVKESKEDLDYDKLFI